MLTQCELLENPVALTVQAPDGLHTVTAERLRGGRVRMSCSCTEAARQGWCTHRLRLLCLRFEDVVGASSEETLRLEDMVTGTPLAEIADGVDLALADFESARKGLSASAPTFEPAALRDIAGKAGDLAEAARQLDITIERFKRRLTGAA